MNIVIKLGKKYYSTIEEFAKEIYLQQEEALALIKSEKFLKILYNYVGDKISKAFFKITI